MTSCFVRFFLKSVCQHIIKIKLRRDAPDGEGIGLVASPAGSEFSPRRLLPVSGSIAPKLDQPGLLWMEF
jgi:hypothetical protein